jgi:hypothetical protein
MLAFKMERSRSDSSTSSLSSALSLSPSGWTPRASTLSPATTTTSTPVGGSPDQLNTKPRVSLWQQHYHPMKRASTAPMTSAPETFCPSSGRGAFGYPCWPAGESLSVSSSPQHQRSYSATTPISPTSSAASCTFFQPPTSRISDDYLEQLQFSGRQDDATAPPALEVVAEVPVGAPEACQGGISWSQVGALAAQQQAQPSQPERRRRLPPPPPGMAMTDDRRRKRGPSRSSSRGGTAKRRVSQPAAC